MFQPTKTITKIIREQTQQRREKQRCKDRRTKQTILTQQVQQQDEFI